MLPTTVVTLDNRPRYGPVVAAFTIFAFLAGIFGYWLGGGEEEIVQPTIIATVDTIQPTVFVGDDSILPAIRTEIAKLYTATPTETAVPTMTATRYIDTLPICDTLTPTNQPQECNPFRFIPKTPTPTVVVIHTPTPQATCGPEHYMASAPRPCFLVATVVGYVPPAPTSAGLPGPISTPYGEEEGYAGPLTWPP